MKRVLGQLLLLALAVAVAIPLSAQDAGQKKKKKADKGAAPFASIVKNLEEKANLTEEQATKIKELQKELGAKLTEAGNVIGPKRKALAEARKKAASEGKKGKEASEAAAAEVGLTEAEKSAMETSQRVQGEFQRAVYALLTPEQREKAGLKALPEKKKKSKKDA